MMRVGKREGVKAKVRFLISISITIKHVHAVGSRRDALYDMIDE